MGPAWDFSHAHLSMSIPCKEAMPSGLAGGRIRCSSEGRELLWGDFWVASLELSGAIDSEGRGGN